MTIQARDYSVEDFEEFVELPENAEKLFEFIGGEIFEVPSNPFSSKINQIISGELYIYLKQNDIGHLTGEQGGYIVAGERYAPDVAFISSVKQPELVKQGYHPTPPDLAVEVISSDSTVENEKLTIKLTNYLSVGTLVWIVRPEKKYVEVHQTGLAVKVFGEKDTLDGGDVLPNLQIKVSDILK
jgi:Uma2 family endonuclease